MQQKRRFCHFYVNTGQCNFEEKTGSKCKFLHEKAPMCISGVKCSRTRCMFSHPNTNAIQNFLRPMKSMSGNSVHMLNPWQMTNWNPWGTLIPLNQQMINPWQNSWNQN